MAASRTIVVAGAGIGGLTASLALAARGFRVVVLEKAERLEEAGAGLQLSPNASRVLIELGLQPRLAARAVIPDAISIMSARSGGEIARLPLGEAATFRAGAPYWVVHRADLQAALQAEVNDHPDIELRLGCQFEDVVTHAKGLTVVQRSGMTRQQELALALIGADGIWSAVRHHLFPAGAAAILRADRLARHARGHAVAARIYLAPGPALDGTERASGRLSDLGRAPDQRRRGGAGHLEQAGLERARRRRPKSRTRSPRRVAGPGADDDRRRRRLAEMGAVHGSRWRRMDRTARSRCWATPRTPCCRLPRKARAWRSRMPRCWPNASAKAPAKGGPAIPAALKRYARLRRARVARVQRTARRNGTIYHLTGPRRWRATSRSRRWAPDRMLARQDWIYDWRV